MQIHNGFKSLPYNICYSSYRCRCSFPTDPRQPRGTVAVVLNVIFKCHLHYPTSSVLASPRSDVVVLISRFLPDMRMRMLPTSVFGHCNPGDRKPAPGVLVFGVLGWCPVWGREEPEEGPWPRPGEADRAPRWVLSVLCSTAVLRSTLCLWARRGRHLLGLDFWRLHPAP